MIIVAMMAVDFVVVLFERLWLSAFLILAIALLILLVTVFSDRIYLVYLSRISHKTSSTDTVSIRLSLGLVGIVRNR